jgi:hypothetical protein
MTTATATRERPILFSAEMVRAILEDRKSQTRRIIKPQPYRINGRLKWEWAPKGAKPGPRGPIPSCAWRDSYGDGCPHCDVMLKRCPYGIVGDRLWVRESFTLLDHNGWFDCGKPKLGITPPRRNAVAYRADCAPGSESDDCRIELGYKWKPSIHMPRWASRIDLELVSVRVQRLQEINQEDAIAEGRSLTPGDPRGYFPETWNRINGPGAWERNDWVWAITFKRITEG